MTFGPFLMFVMHAVHFYLSFFCPFPFPIDVDYAILKMFSPSFDGNLPGYNETCPDSKQGSHAETGTLL